MFISTRTGAARGALLLGAALSFATPIWAQTAALDAAATMASTAPLQQALAADGVPLTLSVSALDASWRRFKPGKSLDSNFKTTLDSQESASYSYFTRGETLKVGDETFLVAYRVPLFMGLPNGTEVVSDEDYADVASNASEADSSAQTNLGGSGTTPDNYNRLLAEQTLKLCLFNARSLDGLGDIRAFDAETDVLQVVTAADRERAQQQALAERASLRGDALNQRVTSDLKQIGLAMLQYTQDYDEKLPPMRSSQSMADIRKHENSEWDNPSRATVQQVLQPYMKSSEIFAHPTTREIYRPNLNLSGRNLASLTTSPEQIITFYEASPAPDGTRAVLYLDGHVRRELETAWANIRATSDRFAPPFNAGKRALNGTPANATVTLHDAAATAYQIKQWKKNPRHTQTLYLSKSIGRVYYRDDKTHQAIFIDAPADGIALSAVQAAPFRAYKGYNGQTEGRVLSDDFEVV